MGQVFEMIQWLIRASFRKPSDGFYWAPSASMLMPTAFSEQYQQEFLDGFPDGVTEVRPGTKGFVSFRYINEDGQEMARTNYYKFVPIDLDDAGWFAQAVKEAKETFDIGQWWNKIAMPVNLYSEEVPLASYGKTPTMSALEMAFGGNEVALDDFVSGRSTNGKSAGSKTNLTPFLLAGIGFMVGGPLGAGVGFFLGSQTKKPIRPSSTGTPIRPDYSPTLSRG